MPNSKVCRHSCSYLLYYSSTDLLLPFLSFSWPLITPCYVLQVQKSTIFARRDQEVNKRSCLHFAILPLGESFTEYHLSKQRYQVSILQTNQLPILGPHLFLANGTLTARPQFRTADTTTTTTTNAYPRLLQRRPVNPSPVYYVVYSNLGGSDSPQAQRSFSFFYQRK